MTINKNGSGVDLENNLKSFLKCPECGYDSQTWNEHFVRCNSCGAKTKIEGSIPRFVDGSYHSNFGLQWNKFSTVQLDSFNGSDESEMRLLNQSKLCPEDFNGKTILEVGAGNGRFTEIFLKFGARVLAVDYSSAIEANWRNHKKYIDKGRLLLIQGDLFNLPLTENSFDIVFCYGVIQHTGDNQKAISELSKFPKDNGRLLMDIYSTSLKDFNPLIYLIRPFFSLLKVDDEKRLDIVEKFIQRVFPIQLKILRRLHRKKGLLKLLRWVVNRSPNSVYGINLFLYGKIDLDYAYKWSVMDTYDAWVPKHDHPVSRNKWVRLVSELNNKGYKVDDIDVSGQGHTAVLTRIRAK
jgi:ubiquinone/menaquinone biosynthesis C-methylase UbiE